MNQKGCYATGNTFRRCGKGIELTNASSLIDGNNFIECTQAIQTYKRGADPYHTITNNLIQNGLRGSSIWTKALIQNNKFDNGGQLPG
jgi:hypothetical protein